ncbi:hypothetical protein AAF712_011999 [Marasmius tenuissimus]|uniref:Alpha/beta-hydrolase n=1 Tax=Marasmius tenuissimus TaxID=585030 RepID=A0ABR2ZJN6_9AGAR
MSIPQMQYTIGRCQSLDCYKKWSEKEGLPIHVEEIEGEDARLLWVGEKRTDRVIFLHGGGYALPLAEFSLSFWRHVQTQLGEKGLEIDVVVLNYGGSYSTFTYSPAGSYFTGLIPDAPFPTPLRQAVCGLQLLINNGVKPNTIQLVGDSAGGNLILQLFSHLLHPLPGVPNITHDNLHFKGACLLSPWVSFRDDDGTHALRESTDLIKVRSILEFGDYVLQDVPQQQECYVELLKTPDSWWARLDSKVERMLLVAGSDECFKEDIVKISGNIRKYHTDAVLLIQQYGVYVELYVDFLVGEKRLQTVTGDIVEWLVAGFSGSTN